MKTIIGFFVAAGLLIYLGVNWLIILGLLGVIGIIQWYLRGIVKKAAEKVFNDMPDNIDLVRLPSPAWKNPEKMNTFFQDLQDLGFSNDGIYSIPQMPGILLAGFVSRKHSLLAVAYEHPAGLNWVDIVGEYVDGSELTVSSAPKGDEFEPFEGVIKIFEKTDSVNRLFEIACSQGEKGITLKPVAEGSFKAFFEEGYARDIQRRKNRRLTSQEADRFLEAESE